MTDQLTTKAIKALFDIHKSQIPKRSHKILSDIENAVPGLDSKPVKEILKHMDSLVAGDMIVLAGPIGCGKSVASHIGAMVFLAKKYLIPLHEKYLEESETKDGDKCFEKALDVYQNVANKPEGMGFRIVKAFDVIPDSFKDGELGKLNKDPKLVIIDDLGREHFTDRGYGISIWDEVFDCWYYNIVPRIINTNMTPDEFVKKYNRRIHDRLKQCARWVNLTGKSLRKQG